jgi:hypothetical protein
MQESFPRPRVLLEPISSEPVRHIGLGSSLGHDPKRTLFTLSQALAEGTENQKVKQGTSRKIT